MAKTVRITTRYTDEDMRLSQIGEYQDGSPAYALFDANGEEYATATVCIPGNTPPSGHVLIKNWSENEGVLESLVAAGILQVVADVPSGFVNAQLCKLLVSI